MGDAYTPENIVAGIVKPRAINEIGFEMASEEEPQNLLISQEEVQEDDFFRCLIEGKDIGQERALEN